MIPFIGQSFIFFWKNGNNKTVQSEPTKQWEILSKKKKKIGHLKKIAVIILKFEKDSFTTEKSLKKDADRMTNSEDWSDCSFKTICSGFLSKNRYIT